MNNETKLTPGWFKRQMRDENKSEDTGKVVKKSFKMKRKQKAELSRKLKQFEPEF